VFHKVIIHGRTFPFLIDTAAIVTAVNPRNRVENTGHKVFKQTPALYTRGHSRDLVERSGCRNWVERGHAYERTSASKADVDGLRRVSRAGTHRSSPDLLVRGRNERRSAAGTARSCGRRACGRALSTDRQGTSDG
jgi:hypothetical protein